MLIFEISPLLIWGVFIRLLGLVYFIAIISFLPQILALAGSKGINPVKDQLQKMREDFGYKRFLYFPTLLWLNSSDCFLKLLVILGACSSLLVICGFYSWYALLLCWLIYLSLDTAVDLAYPWECLLLEAGFLALFLPSLHALPHLTITSLPLPIVAWAYRWLLFRLVFGFGKFKFLGTNKREFGYIKDFLIAQPLPTPIAWYLHRLPLLLLKLSLGFLFIVEIIMPFFIFATGTWRIVTALTIMTLMLGIQLTGNYGFFNILTIVLCIPLFDVHSVLGDPFLYIHSHFFTHITIAIVFIGGIIYLPFNSWCTRTWLYWPIFFKIRFWPIAALLNFYRLLDPWHIVHAYGVFPPYSLPPVKWVPIIEGTDDGKTWQQYNYRYVPSTTKSAPKFVAPYLPRLDHFVFYEAYGANASNFFSSTFGVANPYRFTHSSPLERLCQRLLEGNPQATKLFAYSPFPASKPPIAIRIQCYLYKPTTYAQKKQTGAWWTRHLTGPHLPIIKLDKKLWHNWLADPEIFHWDEIIWKYRSKKIKTIMDKLTISAREEDLAEFWEFVSFLQNFSPKLDNVVIAQTKIQQKYTIEQLQTFEKIWGQLSMVLLAKLQPQIKAKSFFHLGMFIYGIIGQGKDTYNNFIQQVPNDLAAKINKIETGTFYLALFWKEMFAFHARKLRIIEKISDIKIAQKLLGFMGFMELLSILAEQFKEEDENIPTFLRSDSGKWEVVL